MRQVRFARMMLSSPALIRSATSEYTLPSVGRTRIPHSPALALLNTHYRRRPRTRTPPRLVPFEFSAPSHNHSQVLKQQRGGTPRRPRTEATDVRGYTCVVGFLVFGRGMFDVEWVLSSGAVHE